MGGKGRGNKKCEMGDMGRGAERDQAKGGVGAQSSAGCGNESPKLDWLMMS